MSQEKEAYLAMRERFARLCAISVAKNRMEERLANAPAEFDAFCNDTRVLTAAVDNKSFAFGTTRLVMTGNAGPRWAGAFVVKIDAGSAAICCRSLERPDNVVQHPHVYGGPTFNPCLGQNEPAVAKLRGDGKLARLGIFMIEFLEVYFTGNAHHQSAEDFDRLTQEEIVQWNGHWPDTGL